MGEGEKEAGGVREEREGREGKRDERLKGGGRRRKEEGEDRGKERT